MPKKSKTGKSRKDEYYYMAKNTGLRARSSFKLIEINKLFHFLEKATILIDLCAAPGGWMQIAARTMKKSSFIIGIDLVPIKPIPGTISIQADITTDKCKQLIKNEILKAKADVILHDGAPNVGANWNVDEFQQAHLCLKAFALATEFLVRNGTFVTKVFRSKDYESLKWVFDQLFEKVQVVKPKSSRNESAEIFLVCLNYKAPTVIDPKFLDISHVFEDVNEENEMELTYAKSLKLKKKAIGYQDGDTLYKEVKVGELLTSKIPVNILLTANKIILDDEEIKNHPYTTEMIKQYLADLKLIGKYDFRALEKWIKKISPIYKKLHNLIPEIAEIEQPERVEKTEEELIQEEIDKCEDEIKKTEKKKLRKARQDKMKQIKLIQMDMLHPGDVIDQDDDMDMFSASKNQDLIESGIIQTEVDVSELDKIIIPMDIKRKADNKIVKPTKETYEKISDKYYDKGKNLKTFEDSDKDSEDEFQQEDDVSFEIESDESVEADEYSFDDLDDVSDEEQEEESGREEINDENSEDIDENSEDIDEKSEQGGIEENSEEEIGVNDENSEEEDIDENSGEEMDVDLDNDDNNNSEEVADISEEEEDNNKKNNKKSKITDLNFDPEAPTKKAKEIKRLNSWFDNSEFSKLMNDVDNSEEDEGSSDEELIEDISDEKHPFKVTNEKAKEKKADSAIDTKNPNHSSILNTLKRKLTPKERALAVEMIKSKKSRREILEWGYNRYMFEDEKLPSWFVADEKKHMVSRLPFLNKAAIDAQKSAVSTNINKRTIKKVEQAKARKKNHMMRKLKRLNKKAEKIDDDLMEVEKRKQLQDLSKKVAKLKNTKKPVVTEVTNRSGQRSRVGAYKKGAKLKIVDKRMKKDARGKSKDDKNRGKKRGRK